MNDAAAKRTKAAKDRMKATSDSEPLAPLARLAKSEADLHKRSEIVAGHTPEDRTQPDPYLCGYQITEAVRPYGLCGTLKTQIEKEALASYTHLRSRILFESIVHRHIIVASAAAMNCMAHANMSSHPVKVDVYNRNYVKLTRLVLDLIEARDRWRSPKQVHGGNVNNVNVEAGVTIVGNMEPPGSKSDDCNSGLPVPAKKRSRRGS